MGTKKLDNAEFKLTEMVAPLLRPGNTLFLCPVLLFYTDFWLEKVIENRDRYIAIESKLLVKSKVAIAKLGISSK